jgi:MoxR-like ATPase
VSAQTQNLAKRCRELETRLGEVILGKPDLIRDVVTGLLAGGHVLLEGLPGLGKTMLVRGLSSLCRLEARRIQFTPDLMPLDVTGSYILSEEGGARGFKFHPGPLFGNLILADEINRASPKTQSALLEAMQERRVTVIGNTHELPRPFWVMATQNPIEMEGTYPLPEAQLDRFVMKLLVSDVPADVLETILLERGKGELPEMQPVMAREEIAGAMAEVEAMELSRPIASYIARLVRSTHAGEGPEAAKPIKYGASPRAALAMGMCARARAFLDGRETVGFEDVKAVAPPTLRHRIILDYAARLDGVTPDAVVADLLDAVEELDRKPPAIIAEKQA